MKKRVTGKDGTLFPYIPFEVPLRPEKKPPSYLLGDQPPNFEKLNYRKGPIKSLIKKPKVDRSDWKKQILNKHKGLADLRERVFPLQRATGFARIFNPVQKQVKQKFSNEQVLQLIMHHMVALGLRNTQRIIEMESGVKYKPQYLNDSRLHTIVRSAIKKSEKVYRLTLDEKPISTKKNQTNNQVKNNNNNNQKIKKEEKKEEEEEKDTEVIEHLVNIGLKDDEDDDEDDVPIWDEPEGEKYLKYSTEKGKDGRPHIKAATTNKMVEKLTDPTGVSMDYLQTCLLTYQSFTSSEKLLTKLIERFHVPKLRTENEDEYNRKKNSVQIRVGNAIKIWIDKYLQTPSEKVLHYLEEFLKGEVQEQHPKMAQQLLKKFEALKERKGKSVKKVFMQDPPEPIIPKNIFSPKLNLFDVDELEIARQITLIDYDMYSKIQPTELLNLSWSKAKYKHRAQNVLAFIYRFNNLSHWIATEILHHDKIRKRTAILDKTIRLAGKLRELQNFNSIIAILSGLNSASVHRLKFTWEDLPKTSQEIMNKLDVEMSADQAYKRYRQALHGVNPPCIPYLGVYLTDLTFIEDGNPNKVDGLINFYKRRLVYAVIDEIQQYQLRPYSFQRIHQIYTHLDKLKIWDENECYKRSLKYEPRKSKRDDIK